MAEIYQPDDDPLLTYPPVSDYSFDLDQLIHFFGRSFRHHCSSVVNRYLFSWDNDFLCIMPLRSKFRVIGRVSVDITYIKRCVDYDVFFVGSLQECIDKMRECIAKYTLIV